jgi:hypothetical protein
MKKHTFYILIVIFCILCTTAVAKDFQVSRRYYDDGMIKEFGANIILRGTAEHIIKFTRWLDQIAKVPKGFQTLKMISDTPHELVILSTEHARISAGRTIAPMTMDIINGVGDSVQIIFDANTADEGSHMVFNSKKELIEYTAIQNLYHELAHAMHMMNGTWRYFASEDQAIEEENIFRRQLAEQQGRPWQQRYRIDGILISDVARHVAHKGLGKK